MPPPAIGLPRSTWRGRACARRRRLRTASGASSAASTAGLGRVPNARAGAAGDREQRVAEDDRLGLLSRQARSRGSLKMIALARSSSSFRRAISPRARSSAPLARTRVRR
jgi:hypothetical protein